MTTRDIHPAILAATETGERSTTAPVPSAPQSGRGEEIPVSSPRFLALDQSARAIGYAIGSATTSPRCGTIGLPALVGPSGTDEIGAIGFKARELVKLCIQLDAVTHVIYEAVYFDEEKNNPETFGQLSFVKGLIRLICIDHRLTCTEVAPGDWRDHFLGFRDRRALKGTGITLKDAALDRCKERGWKPDSEHAAEALGMLDWALAQRDPAFAVRSNPSPLFRGVT